MSVKDRVADLEDRLELINALWKMEMKGARSSRNGLFDRIAHVVDDVRDIKQEIRELNADINTLKEALPDVEDKINSLEKKIENYNPDDFIRGDLHRKCNYLHRCMEGVQFKIKELEALEARVEELENAETDTRRNAPDNSAKPEKFIKVVDNQKEHYLLRSNKLDAIKSFWEDNEGEIMFMISRTCGVIKSYSDKEAWQHDLNKIEWFVYDDALLLDLTGLVAQHTSTNWKSCKGLPGFCPYCGSELLCYAKTGGYLGETARMCTKCDYKES